MNSILKTDGNGLINLLHTTGSDLALPNPFEQEIFLFDTYVAGTSHIKDMEELAPYLNIGDQLNFFREPDNVYDNKAIVIKNANGVKIGYVPKHDNIVFSRLMDAGKCLFGVIMNKELSGKWLKIEIKIYLKE